MLCIHVQWKHVVEQGYLHSVNIQSTFSISDSTFHIPEVVEHHKENYEAEVAAVEAAANQISSSSSDWSHSDDESSSFLSFGQMVGESGLTTPTEVPLIDFDEEMDIIDFDDLVSDSDSEILSPP